METPVLVRRTYCANQLPLWLLMELRVEGGRARPLSASGAIDRTGRGPDTEQRKARQCHAHLGHGCFYVF